MNNMFKSITLVLIVTVLVTGCRDELERTHQSPLFLESKDSVQRGQYLARAGNCMACHTRSGEPAFSGGKAISTPFGDVISSNLTSDNATGLGDWNADDFWQALHHGKSRDGRSLYPAFPYPSYSLVVREDSDALFAYFQTIPPITLLPQPSQLRFPYNYQWTLDIWRMLYFRPAVFKEDPTLSAQLNRGAYLVNGLGHCAACHTPRGIAGNTKAEHNLAGAYVDGLGWNALPLTNGPLSENDKNQMKMLLQGGINQRDVLSGPMAEIVAHSLQYLNDEDIGAMVEYLAGLPELQSQLGAPLKVSDEKTSLLRKQGRRVYADHCSDCHGADGEGQAYRYPALVANLGVTAISPNNAIQALMFGGFGASTKARPRPYGMPAYAHQLSDDEAASVLTYIRSAWGNSASAVHPQQLRRVELNP